MFEILGALISSVVELLIKKADLKRDEQGPALLYELYVSLRKMIRNANRIVELLEAIIQKPYLTSSLMYDVEKQSKELHEFSFLLWKLSFIISIYDDANLAEQLQQIIGFKYRALGQYYQSFYKMDAERITKLDKGEIVRVADEMGVDISQSKLDEYLTFKDYDLSKASDLRRLRNGALENIKLMENSLAQLASFIQTNCEIKDLFPVRNPEKLDWW